MARVGYGGRKTTLTEALLAKAGAITPAAWKKGTTVCDYDLLENMPTR